jgi:hypothetical protein
MDMLIIDYDQYGISGGNYFTENDAKGGAR